MADVVLAEIRDEGEPPLGRCRREAIVCGYVWYWSSGTCSIQSTALPSSFSWTAMWVIAVVAVAPCQCFSPGANQTTSPGRISSTGPPQRWAQPQPDVTIRVWP